MTQPSSPYEAQPPSARRLLKSAGVAIIGAVLALVLFVLPAEYGIDPTGIGGKLGLTALSSPGSGTRTIQIEDVTGGNDTYHEVAVPDVGKPTPLPNPAVHQDEAAAPQTRTLTVSLQPDQETEVKLRLQKAKAVVYSWRVDRGQIYVDFHGHDPSLGNDVWVRYKEQEAGQGNNGSLVAPFSGEHGWFWQNYNAFPVVITLTVTGYFDEVVDYGLL